jgi:hypothetical protein
MKRAAAGSIVLFVLLAGLARTEPSPVIYVFDEAFAPFSFEQAGALKGEPLLVAPIYHVFSAGPGALRDQVSEDLETFMDEPAPRQRWRTARSCAPV